MGLPPQTPTPPPPHLYPQALQLKLYQAFIFSIPILFSIILFLLFYLFYLKRRASTLSSPPQVLPNTSSHAATTYISSICEINLKEEVKDKLPTVLFDEDMKRRDSQCCVCLGEFEMKEELLQIPSCKHVFHIECIHHWLHSNSTCPLCRCFVIFPTTTTTKTLLPLDSSDDDLHHHHHHHHHHVQLQQDHDHYYLPSQEREQEQEQEQIGANSTREHIITISVGGGHDPVPV